MDPAPGCRTRAEARKCNRVPSIWNLQYLGDALAGTVATALYLYKVMWENPHHV